MSARKIRSVPLTRISKIRVACKNPSCEAVTEILIERIPTIRISSGHSPLMDGNCPVCRNPFQVTGDPKERLSSNFLGLLAEAFGALQKQSETVGVEFIVRESEQ